MNARLVVMEGAVDDGPPAPPWPHVPTVEWQVCGVCNYDCSYCIQSRAHRVGHPDAALLDRMLGFLSSLPGTWEVKTTGGEPFAFKGFMDRVVPALVRTPHRVSTLTNLSAPLPVLSRFAELTHGRLSVLSASLHLEFTSAETFIRKLSALRPQLAGDARVVVNCVLVPDRLDDVQEAQRKVEDAGFTFFPQLMKVKGGVHAYTPEQVKRVRDIVGDLALAEQRRTANMAPAYTGRRCWTGARYLVLAQDGSAWSCRSARRHGQGFLGNVVDGVKLRAGPVHCPYTVCPCAVPANRGMIEDVPMRGATTEDA